MERLDCWRGKSLASMNTTFTFDFILNDYLYMNKARKCMNPYKHSSRILPPPISSQFQLLQPLHIYIYIYISLYINTYISTIVPLNWLEFKNISLLISCYSLYIYNNLLVNDKLFVQLNYTNNLLLIFYNIYNVFLNISS